MTTITVQQAVERARANRANYARQINQALAMADCERAHILLIYFRIATQFINDNIHSSTEGQP